MEKDKLNRTQYVLGFAFSSDKKDIVLIEKQKTCLASWKIQWGRR